MNYNESHKFIFYFMSFQVRNFLTDATRVVKTDCVPYSLYFGNSTDCDTY